ncbi:hypothetical protein VNO77_22873 [Canavalia gladiata]|uniref:Uncharacterized protein n=1 Tax=Canavalia gladiata TaxID=3824 RepID=A0AAN9L3X1_CANGL
MYFEVKVLNRNCILRLVRSFLCDSVLDAVGLVYRKRLRPKVSQYLQARRPGLQRSGLITRAYAFWHVVISAIRGGVLSVRARLPILQRIFPLTHTQTMATSKIKLVAWVVKRWLYIGFDHALARVVQLSCTHDFLA